MQQRLADTTNGDQVLGMVEHVTAAEITADDFVSMDIWYFQD